MAGPARAVRAGFTKEGGDIVRFVGDQVAAIVAETEAQAAAARDLIEVEYEDLPVVMDAEAAMQPDAPRVHAEIGDSNICVHYKIRKGDIEAGFEQADVIVEGEYRTPVQEHAYLQPEAGLAYIDEDGHITVKAGGQWTHADREQIAHALGLPDEKVRIVYPAIGGAFGGREDMSVQIVLALAAWKLRRPVRIIWSRQESIIGHGKRHASVLRAKWGATKEGKLVAAEIEMIGDAGAYMYTTNKVLGQLCDHIQRPILHPQHQNRRVRRIYQQRPRRGLSRDLARRKPCIWPNCRWTNWPKSWTWTRSNSV